MKENYKSPPAKKVFEFEGKVVEKHFGDIVKKVDAQGNETTSQNPTPEATEAAKKYAVDLKRKIGSYDRLSFFNVRDGFLAGAEIGDAQGYARAKSEMQAKLESKSNFLKELCQEWNEDCEPNCDSFGHSNQCKATNLAEAKKAMRLEIAQLKQEVALAKERLGPAGYKILEEHARLKQEVEQAKGNLDIYKRSMVSAKTEWDSEIARLTSERNHAAKLMSEHALELGRLKQANAGLVEALKTAVDLMDVAEICQNVDWEQQADLMRQILAAARKGGLGIATAY